MVEPAFWMGQPRTNVGAFVDYFASLVGWERFRASQFGIAHYTAIGLNSKEANNEALAKEVLDVLPRFAFKEGVVAIGEIGYDEITAGRGVGLSQAAGARPPERDGGHDPLAAPRQEARCGPLSRRGPGGRHTRPICW